MLLNKGESLRYYKRKFTVVELNAKLQFEISCTLQQLIANGNPHLLQEANFHFVHRNHVLRSQLPP